MSVAHRPAAFGIALAVAIGVGGTILYGGRADARLQEPAAPPAAAPEPQIDPKARELIDRMVAAYGELRSYSSRVETSADGVTGFPERRGTIAFRRPDRAAVSTTGTGGASRAAADGKHLFAVEPGDGKRYLRQPIDPEAASPIPAAIAAGGADVFGLMGIVVGGQDPTAPFGGSLRTLSVGPAGTVAGIPVETVQAELGGPQGERATVILAIGRDDRLLRQIMLRQEMDGRMLTARETYSEVRVNPTLADRVFAFTPPAGAQPVESLRPLPYDSRLRPGAEPLPIAATDLDGKPVSLDQYRGKVVLIDFWATWCGPCVVEMPHVVKAYERFKDQGFEILGISLDREGAREKLVAFTQEHRMPWRQVYDGKFWQAEVAQAYGVQSIPFTVLIGRDGKIAALNLRGNQLEPAIQAALGKE